MVLRTSYVVLAGVVLLAALFLSPAPAEAARRTAPDLFYNYYVPPGPCGGVGAQLYVSPRPVPERVGHTWITYQPLLPHEYLYKHSRCYHRRFLDARGNCTHVKYRHAILPNMVPTYVDGHILGHLFDH
jgi:hypothetical protein